MKRRIIVILLSSVIAFMFLGCAGMTIGKIYKKGLVEKHTGMHYKIIKTNEGDYAIKPDISFIDDYHKYNDVLSGYDIKSDKARKKKEEVFYALLNATAQATKSMGYNYFVLTNPEINGFGGFPINTYDNFIRYITLEDRKPNFDTLDPYNSFNYRNLITRHGEVTLRFVPVSKKVYDSGLYAVWRVADFK